MQKASKQSILHLPSLFIDLILYESVTILIIIVILDKNFAQLLVQAKSKHIQVYPKAQLGFARQIVLKTIIYLRISK